MINRCTEESSNKSPQIDSPLTEKIPGEHSSSKTSPQDVIDNLRQYAPDDETLGICYYFKGISLSYLHCLDDSFISFENALHSSFCKILTEDDKIQNKINYPNNYHEIEYNKLHNRMLCYFSIAKIFQRKSNHLLAVEYFTRSLDELPNHEGRAFIYFRRAWSYKVVKKIYSIFFLILFFILFLPYYYIFFFNLSFPILSLNFFILYYFFTVSLSLPLLPSLFLCPLLFIILLYLLLPFFVSEFLCFFLSSTLKYKSINCNKIIDSRKTQKIKNKNM